MRETEHTKPSAISHQHDNPSPLMGEGWVGVRADPNSLSSHPPLLKTAPHLLSSPSRGEELVAHYRNARTYAVAARMSSPDSPKAGIVGRE